MLSLVTWCLNQAVLGLQVPEAIYIEWLYTLEKPLRSFVRLKVLVILFLKSERERVSNRLAFGKEKVDLQFLVSGHENKELCRRLKNSFDFHPVYQMK